jgi:lactosylceramide 4-alpha-galactosyltransferase
LALLPGNEYQNPRTSEHPVINLRAAGPETFCPPFARNSGFTERITFLEVSGEECLFPRSVCGIESTARANPEMQIYVYINTNKSVKSQKHYVVKKPGRIRSCKVMELLNQFPNVHFIREDLLSYFQDSKFAPLYESGLLNKSSWSYVHLSDALRHIILYKYGGFYLDSDIITFRPLHCLRNAMSYLNEVPHIENGNGLTYEYPFIFFKKNLQSFRHHRVRS